MRVYLGAALVLLGIIIIVVTRQQGTLPEGQAGLAYTENEQGELVLSTGERASERTVVPPRQAASGVVTDGSEEEWLSRFELTERSGAQLGSQDLKGQPYVAGFFFSTCPSICVQQNSKVKELQERFKGQPIRFVSISCDPEVDNPEVLSDYAKRFDADPDQWLFFTGKMDYIRRVGAEFFSLGVVRRGHPEKFALMDAEGKPYGLYTWSDEGQWAALVRDIEKMLAAGGVLSEEPAATDADSANAATDVSASGSGSSSHLPSGSLGRSAATRVRASGSGGSSHLPSGSLGRSAATRVRASGSGAAEVGGSAPQSLTAVVVSAKKGGSE